VTNAGSTASPPRAVARLAMVLGGILLLGAVGHTIGVARRFATAGVPDGHRVAFLAFITFFHVTGGALDLLGGRGLARGEAWPRGVLSVAAGLILAYSLTMIPVIQASSPLFRGALLAYALSHAVLAALVWRRGSGQFGQISQLPL
jgi:hypothetical protein